jgi:hypothetical protein
MAASRFSYFAGSLLIFTIAVPAWSQDPESQGIFGPPTKSAYAGCCCEAFAGPIRKTYSLADMGDDPKLGAWIAEMLPQVVQPGTWNIGEAPQRRVLSYYAPAKMLLVYHTPAVHDEIDEFLRGIKKSLPATTATARAPGFFGLAQTQFVVPAAHVEPAPAPGGYPVPAQTAQPRHLFHFIIRYEGDGVIDRNVVDFTKAYAKENAVATTTTSPSTSPETATESKAEVMPATPVKAGTATQIVTPDSTVPSCCVTGCCPAPASRATATPTIPASTPAPAPGLVPAR